MWLAFPVASSLQPVVNSLFEDLGISGSICWIVPKSAADAPGDRRHVWDAAPGAVETWRQAAAETLRRRRGRFPERVNGLRLKPALVENLRFHLYDNPADVARIRLNVLTSAHVFLAGVEKLFEEGQVEGAFIWNQWGYACHILRELCLKHGKPFWYLEQGFLPRTICFSRQGLYDEAHTPGMLDLQTSLTMEQVAGNWAHYLGSCVIEGDGSRASIPSLRPLVLVAGQLDRDSSIIFRCPECDTNLRLLECLRLPVPGAVVFKPHPYDRTDYSGCGHRVVPATCSLPSLIRECDVLVTRNSGSGIEAILHDKPVVHVGRAIYRVDILSTAATLSSLGQAVAEVLDNPPPLRPQWQDVKARFLRWLIAGHLYLPEGHPGPFRRASLERILREFKEAV